MRAQTREATEVLIATSGQVSPTDIERAREVVLGAAARASLPLSSARVTLSVVAGSELPRPALFPVTCDLVRRRVRVQAASPALREAIYLMGDRFAHKITERLAG